MTLTIRQQLLRTVWDIYGDISASRPSRKSRAAAIRELSSLPFVDLAMHDWPELGGRKDHGQRNVTDLRDASLWQDALVCVTSSSYPREAEPRSPVHEVWLISKDQSERTPMATMIVCGEGAATGAVWTVEDVPGDDHVKTTCIFDPSYRFRMDLAKKMDIEDPEHALATNLNWLCDAFNRLRQSDLYSIEVEAAPPRGRELRREAKTVKKKPWLSRGRRIIFMTPGERRTRIVRPHQGGTHASPISHHRVGHWKTLRHERYERNPDGSPRRVWVKPAWVGPREWIEDGATYRVMDIEGQEAPQLKEAAS